MRKNPTTIHCTICDVHWRVNQASPDKTYMKALNHAANWHHLHHPERPIRAGQSNNL